MKSLSRFRKGILAGMAAALLASASSAWRKAESVQARATMRAPICGPIFVS